MFDAVVGLAQRACPQVQLLVKSVRQVRAVARGIIDADNARSIERVLGYYAEYAVLLPPNEPPVLGRQAIRPRYETLFSSFRPEIVAQVDQVCVSEHLAFVRGHNGGRLLSPDGGKDRMLDDAFFMLLRRGSDGAWQISHLMWHRSSRENSLQ